MNDEHDFFGEFLDSKLLEKPTKNIHDDFNEIDFANGAVERLKEPTE